jgi:multicomponent K+:H+ antiporter subunit E
MSRRRILPRPYLSLAIFALWTVITDAASPGSALLGAVLALALPPLTARFWPDPPRLRHAGAALRLLLIVLADIVLASLSVARRVLGAPERLRPAFIDVPLDLRDPYVATILGSIVSLTPGTVSIDVDCTRWVLQVHVLDVEDASALIAAIKTRYESPLKEIFEC